MKRAEAEALLGKTVTAWTSVNGRYLGTLVEILPFKPWRGKILVTGVLEVAAPFEVGRWTPESPRMGFRPGRVIEVGHSSVYGAPTDGAACRDYVDLVTELADNWQASREKDLASGHSSRWIIMPQMIQAARRRQPWRRLRPLPRPPLRFMWVVWGGT